MQTRVYTNHFGSNLALLSLAAQMSLVATATKNMFCRLGRRHDQSVDTESDKDPCLAARMLSGPVATFGDESGQSSLLLNNKIHSRA